MDSVRSRNKFDKPKYDGLDKPRWCFAAVFFMLAIGLRILVLLSFPLNPLLWPIYLISIFVVPWPLQQLGNWVLGPEQRFLVLDSPDVRGLNAADRLSYLRWLALAANWGGDWRIDFQNKRHMN